MEFIKRLLDTIIPRFVCDLCVIQISDDDNWDVIHFVDDLHDSEIEYMASKITEHSSIQFAKVRCFNFFGFGLFARAEIVDCEVTYE